MRREAGLNMPIFHTYLKLTTETISRSRILAAKSLQLEESKCGIYELRYMRHFTAGTIVHSIIEITHSIAKYALAA